MTRSIAIVGAGQAGLQLGIGLLEKGFAVTLVADRSADEVFHGRLTATAGLFATALSYEAELGLDLWADQAPLIDGVHIDFCIELRNLLLSIEGIGPRTAIALLIRMPELGRLSRGQAAALAGLAPFNNDSGKRSRPRSIAGGRERVRTSLYAAALPAAFRWNAALVALYTRLTSAGKPHKVALVACARKLLVFANTFIARGTPWVTTAAAS